MQFPELEKNMAYNVRIMEKAEEDLLKIVDYISDTLKNQTAADKNFIAFYLIDDVEKIVSIMRIFYAKRDYANLI